MSAAKTGLLALLHRANQTGTEFFSAELGEGDLTARQVIVLDAVESNEGASQTRICEVTGVDRSTLADMIRRLQRQGLIERRRSRADARAYVLKLTEAGRVALSAGKPALVRVEKRMLAALPAKVRVDLLAALELMVGLRVR